MPKNESKKQKSGKKGKSKHIQIIAALSAAIISIAFLAVPCFALNSGVTAEPYTEYVAPIDLEYITYNYYDNANSNNPLPVLYRGDFSHSALLPSDAEMDVNLETRYQLTRYPNGTQTARTVNSLYSSDDGISYDYVASYYNLNLSSGTLGVFPSIMDNVESGLNVPYLSYHLETILTRHTDDTIDVFDYHSQVAVTLYSTDFDVGDVYQVRLSYSADIVSETGSRIPQPLYQRSYEAECLINDNLSFVVPFNDLMRDVYDHALTEGEIDDSCIIENGFVNFTGLGLAIDDMMYTVEMAGIRLSGEQFSADLVQKSVYDLISLYPDVDKPVYLGDDFSLLEFAIDSVEAFMEMPVFHIDGGAHDVTITLGSFLAVVFIVCLGVVIVKLIYGG